MKRVLLHVCCGPCSLMPVQVLRDEGFEVTGYFANPNIHPVTEYLRRRDTMQEVAAKLDLPMLWQDDAYNTPGWLAVVHSLGIADNAAFSRCRYCYESRLTLTHAVASLEGFDFFSTSLLYSRHQQHAMIAEVGTELSAEGADETAPAGKAAFLYRDFRPYWQAGIDLSKEWNLYRQNYCACIFSEYERFEKKLAKLSA
ncbi:MAG: epoxyqueuosine reductase QueH [Bilophila sp.]